MLRPTQLSPYKNICISFKNYNEVTSIFNNLNHLSWAQLSICHDLSRQAHEIGSFLPSEITFYIAATKQGKKGRLLQGKHSHLLQTSTIQKYFINPTVQSQWQQQTQGSGHIKHCARDLSQKSLPGCLTVSVCLHYMISYSIRLAWSFENNNSLNILQECP